MGLCASMLQRRAKKRYPEPRRGTPTALFVVRGDRRRSNPEAMVFQVQDSGRRQLQKPAAGMAETRRPEGCWQQGACALERVLGAQMPRLPCGGTGTVGVEPDAAMSMPKAAAERVASPGRCRTPPTTQMMQASGAMTPVRHERCGTPTAAMTPGRPVWQRRILMGVRCELPRFSGLILYDEQGRRLNIGTPGRRNHRQVMHAEYSDIAASAYNFWDRK
ncbi:uncharacterized protein LOC124656148 [Lolium rigidum]|uniref:uncharacterized protein LOC124656148 n=1 Tax=Lolium rigidum TaxID=89674 RepID=UPI001F5CCFC9|nr:uncharacterized protein LOC124656148 [Lolium rigidum]